MDAVTYSVGALRELESKPLPEANKIALEIAVLGTKSLDVNNPTVKYRLRSLPGEFSGLQLVCFMYVAFQKVAPEQDVGFDLSQEYQMALNKYAQKGIGD